MWLWGICRIMRGILDRFNKILSLRQGEEASLRETKMTEIQNHYLQIIKDFITFLKSAHLYLTLFMIV